MTLQLFFFDPSAWKECLLCLLQSAHSPTYYSLLEQLLIPRGSKGIYYELGKTMHNFKFHYRRGNKRVYSQKRQRDGIFFISSLSYHPFSAFLPTVLSHLSGLFMPSFGRSETTLVDSGLALLDCYLTIKKASMNSDVSC